MVDEVTVRSASGGWHSFRFRSLIRGDILAPGEHRTAWDGRDGRGRPVPSGVYLARLEAGGRKAEQKLHVIR